MTRVALLCDGIANGTTLTLANSGRKAGIPVDIINIGTSCTLTADTGKHFHGNAALHITTISGQNCWARWRTTFRSAGPNQTASLWIYFTANPTASTSILFVSDESALRICEVRVISTGKVQAYDSTGTARVATATSIALNQWVRVDVDFTPHASAGTLALRLHNTPTSSTPTETPTPASGLNLRSAPAMEWFVGTANAPAAVQNYWIQAFLSDQGSAPFGSGFVMSGWVGNVTETTATVKARVLGASSVRLKVSTTSNLTTSPAFTSSVSPDSDGVVELSVTGLTAGTRYYYGFEVDGVIETVMNGEIQTMPSTGPVQFSIGAGSCVRTNSNAGIFDVLKNYVGPNGKPLLLMGHIGDLHYKDLNDPSTALWQGATDNAFTGSKPNEMFRKLHVPYIWSDHDFSHPNTDADGAGGPGAQATYRSRVPHYPLVATDGKGIHHSFGIGDAVLCIFTDSRSYRSPKAQTDDSSKTMLGVTQKAWLKGELSRTDYPLKLWFHDDAWTGTTYVGADYWAAYSTERDEIAAYIVANKCRVVYINGDLHTLAASDGVGVPGNMPMFVVSPMDQTSYLGNATYSEGTYPTYDSTAPEYFSQAGIFDIDYRPGVSISLTFKGVDSAGTTRLTKTLVWALGWSRWDGTEEIPLVLEGVWDGTQVQPLKSVNLAA